MKWVLAQPEDVLDIWEAFAELDQPRWAVGHDKYLTDSWQGALIKTEMNRVLESLCEVMNDELGAAFDQHFGTDTENWVEIDLNETLKIIVAKAASRFTVGSPLCTLTLA